MTVKRTARNLSARPLNRRHSTSRRQRVEWRRRLVLAAFLLLVGLLSLGVLARLWAPTSNTSLTRFDAIIVLGYPADSDGNPTPEQLSRVNEGVREYERGVAPRLIFTGGATRKQFVEAKVMARSAVAEGIPPSAIFVEPNARDTIQNACYSVRIMKAHGWQSAEVVSNGSHLPRAGMIFSHLPVEWRTHAAPQLQPDSATTADITTFLEVIKTVRYLTWARWTEHCEP